MGGIVVLVLGVRHWVISNMDKLREAITRGDSGAIRTFRRLHMAGMLVNVFQLAVVAWGMTHLAV